MKKRGRERERAGHNDTSIRSLPCVRERQKKRERETEGEIVCVDIMFVY